MANTNEFNTLKGKILGKGIVFITHKFMGDLLGILSRDRLIAGKNIKEVPGLDGRRWDIKASSTAATPFFVEGSKLIFNGGTVGYFTGDDISFWHSLDDDMDLGTGDVVYLEYTHSNKDVKVLVGNSIPTPLYLSDGSGYPSSSRVVLAVKKKGEWEQKAHTSFFMSPAFLGDRGVMMFTPFQSLGA